MLEACNALACMHACIGDCLINEIYMTCHIYVYTSLYHACTCLDLIFDSEQTFRVNRLNVCMHACMQLDVHDHLSIIAAGSVVYTCIYAMHACMSTM